MSIGKRINYLRNKKNMTMKVFGTSIGFDQKTADVRISQYESGKRTPKENIINDMANSLEVSPLALNVPEIDSYYGLMHTLFALEDMYGIRVGKIDGEICLRLSKANPTTYNALFDMLSSWDEISTKLKDEQISKEEYDQWRYNYPEARAKELKMNLDALKKLNNE